MEPQQVQRLRTAWLAALVGVTGVTLFTYGFIAAVLTAVAFVGATVLAFTAFILYLLLGDTHPVLRVLLIALLLTGLVVEILAIAGALGLNPIMQF